MNFKKEKQWYALKTPDEGPRIYYRKQNRVLALLSLCLIFGTGIFYFGYLKEQASIFPVILFASLSLYLLIMSCLADSFDFNLKTQNLIRTRGCFPIITRKSIPFSQIESISLEEIKQKAKTPILYGVSINLAAGHSYIAGCFRDKDKLVSVFSQISSVEIIWLKLKQNLPVLLPDMMM